MLNDVLMVLLFILFVLLIKLIILFGELFVNVDVELLCIVFIFVID